MRAAYQIAASPVVERADHERMDAVFAVLPPDVEFVTV
jgi:hypothetical protein